MGMSRQALSYMLPVSVLFSSLSYQSALHAKVFDYVKLDGSGNVLSDNSSTWSCVKDMDTGLVWERKREDDGLQDRSWTWR